MEISEECSWNIDYLTNMGKNTLLTVTQDLGNAWAYKISAKIEHLNFEKFKVWHKNIFGSHVAYRENHSNILFLRFL